MTLFNCNFIWNLSFNFSTIHSRCTTSNGLDNEDENFGIKFNYQLIDDTYVVPQYVEEEISSLKTFNHGNSAYNSDNQVSYGSLFKLIFLLLW